MRVAPILLALLCGCGPDPGPPRPTIVLVTLDTTRRDHLSAYGYPRDTTPFLRELCSRSLRFDRAVSPATWTLPAHVSLFTGLHPSEHGCWLQRTEEREANGVAPSTVLLAQRLAEAGYRTVAAVGGPFPTTRYGVLRGFEEVFEPRPGGQRAGAELNAWLADVLQAGGPEERPLLLFVNYFDAHAPFDAPAHLDYPFEPEIASLHPVPGLVRRVYASPEEEAREVAVAREQYDRELFVQDLALGELWALLEDRGYLEDALVIITADHGEMFGEQPLVYGHGGYPYEPLVNVPLIVYRSGREPGVEQRPVSIRAIHRTVLAAAGLPAEAGGPGSYSLLSLPERVPAPYSEQRGETVWVAALRYPRFKYSAVLQTTPEGPTPARGGLIDFTTNPEERLERTIFDPAVPEAAAAREELLRRIRTWRSPPIDIERVQPSREEAEALQALGYGG